MSEVEQDIFWKLHEVKSLRELEKESENNKSADNPPLPDKSEELDIFKDLNG